MCGLAGLLTPGGTRDEEGTRRAVARMRDSLVHRGPDDHGDWVDPAAGIGLGFRRLSIIDLSAAGHQPMVSADGRYVLAYNGEIYNHREIAAEVEAAKGGHPWRGHSDTEVLVEAIALWGVEAALRRANGMFALALWDRADRTLWLARDRIGKKPLFHGWAGGTFLFASELKALRAHPGFDATVSPDAMSDYLHVGYVPGSRSIYAGIAKLPPGHLLRLDPASAARLETPEPKPYWDLRGAALAGLEAQAAGRTPDPDEFEALLRDAVARRLTSDVPVGAFLSGGIDSSLTTALMAEVAGGTVHSFSIGFPVKDWDEAPHARAVAAHLGTRHEEQYVGGADVRDLVADLGEICDEPMADDSIIPTTLLCRLAQRRVTVALSGDGGDELFAGYARYAAVDGWLARRDRLPGPIRGVGRRVVDALAGPAMRAGQMRLGRRFRLLGTLLRGGGAERVQRMILSQTLDPGAFLAAAPGTPHPLENPAFDLGTSTPVDRMTFMDLGSYLVEDILAKVDRASMSTSLEVRCPLLDYRLIEYSWRYPSGEKLRDGVGKRPLRAALERRVPRTLTDRPKRGFGAPVEVWLRNELRDWAEALMSRPALAAHGMLDVEACRALWEGFATGRAGFNRVIWNLLVFQAWHAALRPAGDAPTPIARAASGARAVAGHYVPS